MMIDKICAWIVKRTSLALHLPYLEINYSLEQTIDGKLVKPIVRKRAKSWTRNAYNFITAHGLGINNYGTSFGAGSLLRKEIDGSIPSSVYQDRLNRWHEPLHICENGYIGGVGVNGHGIVIGTGSTAWSFEDYKLVTTIPDGSSSGQIHYNQMATPTKSYSGSTLKVYQVRYFNNNSGGNINLREIGLIGRYNVSLGVGSNDYILNSREVVSETFLDKAQLKVQYEISLTYP